MNLDEQLRVALGEEAAVHRASAPDVNRLLDQGKTRRHRRHMVRFGVASVLAVVLGGGGVYAADQIDTSANPEPTEPSSRTSPQELFTDNLNLEPGTYRMLVGVDVAGVEIAADLTFYGRDWISGVNPTVYEDRARGGVGIYPPDALASGSGCTEGHTTKDPAPKPSPSSSPGSR